MVASDPPATFVPLDASIHVSLDEAFYDRLGQDLITQEAEFAHQA